MQTRQGSGDRAQEQDSDRDWDIQKQGSGQEEERYKQGQEEAGAGWGEDPERAKEDREREAEGQPELSPSLPGCLSARLLSASPKPLLKLLRVAARKPGGRQPNWKAADGQLPGRRAPRGWRWDKETPWPPALHLHPVGPSQGTAPTPSRLWAGWGVLLQGLTQVSAGDRERERLRTWQLQGSGIKGKPGLKFQ